MTPWPQAGVLRHGGPADGGRSEDAGPWSSSACRHDGALLRGGPDALPGSTDRPLIGDDLEALQVLADVIPVS